jgi:biopolymer transport protein ExbB
MTTPEAGSGENPYGLMRALSEGGLIAYFTFGILVLMSAASWYILFVKLFEQQKIFNQGRRARTTFWQSANLREGAQKLEKNSAYRQIVDDGIRALEQHDKLTDPIDQHDWMLGSLQRSQGAINARLSTGLALLATVGSTAPFVGLFGTVVGIYRALIRIGAAGQASIDAVAGPVGEALIMTALGLVVAVPAVMAYNWLMRRNKAIQEELAKFSNDLHGYMMSGGQVRPVVAAAGAGGRTPTGGTAAASGATAGGAAGGAAAGGTARSTPPSTGPGGQSNISPGGTTSSGSAGGTTSSGPKKV